jgi:hypothetical protein
MDHNTDKYWIEDSELLTEAEKTRLATALRELERQGAIEYRDGRWRIAADVEIEETPEGPAARFRSKEEGSN